VPTLRGLTERISLLAKERWRRIERMHSIRILGFHRLPPVFYGKETEPGHSIPVFAQHAPGPSYLERFSEMLSQVACVCR